MDHPGAATSTHGPWVLKSVRRPWASVAPTAMTSGYAAGYSGRSAPELPAATTTTAPLPTAYFTASCSAGSSSGPPSDRLMVLAPWSAAHVRPWMTSESEPPPWESSTFTGMTLAFQATPAMPSVLSVWAAMMPATMEPWPLSSLEAPAAIGTLVMALKPGTVRPARSGCRPLTPESRTATTCVSEPFERSQAFGIRTVSRYDWSG